MAVLDQFRLDKQVAVITGASRGLGKSMAFAFAEVGATLVLCSRNINDLESVRSEIVGRTGASCDYLHLDVTNSRSVQDCVDTIIKKFGRIDVWVNNAGINKRYPIEDFPEDQYDLIQATNMKGTWLCCRAIAPVLKRQHSGSVINVASVLGAVGLAERTAYCSSKAGTIGLTRTLALEWATHNVRCNALCPGPFLTEINEAIADDPVKVNAVVGQTAMQRWGKLHEIHGAALFLASRASTYVTGSCLFVDGGWSAG